ncbi:MAG: DNA polymerase III subunit beta [Bacilli bacterium]|nr:DNA polymerase III subunit beta [Bacilli bacterium]
MKFTIEKNVILDNLNNVIKAISTKNVIPILNGIKFEMKEEGLYLTASDSELSIKSFIEKKKIKNVESLGSIIIQSKYILEIIRKMPQDIINFEVIDGLKIKIYTDNNQYNLNCFDPSDFPNIKFEEHKEPIMIKSSVLKDMINQTVFAISTQELRPILTGVNFKFSLNSIVCTATDSYRLAKKSIKTDVNLNNDLEVVIPGKSITDLEKIMGEDSDVAIHVFNNKILFVYKNIYFQSNLLSGSYPNTDNLIPTEFEYVIKTKLQDFNDAVDRAALLTQGKDKNIVKMLVNKELLTISSSSSEIGKVEETINIESNNTNAQDISFSSKYMLEALKTMKEDEILILLNSDVKPIVIKSVKDESLIQLILPIKSY